MKRTSICFKFNFLTILVLTSPLLRERNAVDGAALEKKSVLFVGSSYTYVNNLPNDTNTYDISMLNEEIFKHTKNITRFFKIIKSLKPYYYQ